MFCRTPFIKKIVLLLLLVVAALGATAGGNRTVQAEEEALRQLYLPLVSGVFELPVPPNTTVLYASPSGNGSCTSSSSACSDLNHILALAKQSSQPNVLIRMQSGVFTSGAGAVAALSFDWGQAPRNITLEGGYNASWTSISTDPGQTRLDGQGARRVLQVTGITNFSFAVRNATLQNGFVSQPFADAYIGAGLLCHNNGAPGNFISIHLTNVVLAGNRVQGTGGAATGGAGAALYSRCHLAMSNVTFNDNFAQGGAATNGPMGAQTLGGGLLMTSPGEPVSIQGSGVSFNRNRALAGNGGVGIGPHGERADALGGGASLQYVTGVLNDLVMTDNYVEAGDGSVFGGYGGGGGLFGEFNGSLTLNDARFTGNAAVGGNSSQEAAVGGGGAIMWTDGNLTLDRAMILNNRAIGGNGPLSGHGGGGGIYLTTAGVYPTNASFTNIIIADNVAEAGQGQNRWGGGGGIFAQDVSLTMRHATIARNRVLNTMMAPAVMVLHNYHSSTVSMEYSIVADHAAASSPNAMIAQRAGDALLMNRTLFYGNAGNYGPMLGGETIQNNNPLPSGNPHFISPGAPHFNYSIGANSAARDRATGSSVQVDVRRAPRPNPDVGAYEYH